MTLLDPGECESSCGSGACCSDQCADTRSDEQNCGTCGNVCGAGEGCTDGHCGHYCPLCRTWDVATQACAEACDGAQCEICNVTGASSFICESQCMAGDTCHNGTCLTDCTPCTGFDGFVDCCTAAQTCDSTPHKGPPCR